MKVRKITEAHRKWDTTRQIQSHKCRFLPAPLAHLAVSCLSLQASWLCLQIQSHREAKESRSEWAGEWKDCPEFKGSFWLLCGNVVRKSGYREDGSSEVHQETERPGPPFQQTNIQFPPLPLKNSMLAFSFFHATSFGVGGRDGPYCGHVMCPLPLFSFIPFPPFPAPCDMTTLASCWLSHRLGSCLRDFCLPWQPQGSLLLKHCFFSKTALNKTAKHAPPILLQFFFL